MADQDVTRFPFINLEKAIERARVVYEADPAGRPMRIADVLELWGYSQKSSGGFQTISALKMYGIAEDSGANEDRKLQLTEGGRRYFVDEREEEKAKLVRRFAMSPKFVNVVWRDWGARPPADNIARSYLKLDRKLPEQSARSFLGIYKENLAYAGLSDQASMPETEDAAPAAPQVQPSGLVLMAATVGLTGLRHRQEAPLAEGERVVFSEEAGMAQYLRLVASGPMDDGLLEALESYVKRQRARLAASANSDIVSGDAAQKPS